MLLLAAAMEGFYCFKQGKGNREREGNAGQLGLLRLRPVFWLIKESRDCHVRVKS